MNNQLTDNQLTTIIQSAEAVISALAGTNEDVHPDNSTEMCRLYDWLNDNDAPPEVVLAMARELQQRRLADKNFFMYGIADPEGNAYMDEFCVSNDRGLLEDEVAALNDTHDTTSYRVVALYTALPLTDSERAELQERRKAAATPVAWTDEVELRDVEANGFAYLFTVKPITPHADPRRVIKLYAEPPAPVVPPEIEPDYEVIKSILPTANPDEYACCIAADMWNACRAAMLQGKDEPVMPTPIDMLAAVLRNAPLAPSDNQGRRAEPAPVVADDAPCVAQPCPRCGVTSTRPNGEHYCHVKTGSTAHE